jgi:hypothetical protein
MATARIVFSCALALGMSLPVVLCGGVGNANATDRPIAIGEGLGYAVLTSDGFGDESPYVHGRQLQVFARFRRPPAHLQPRVEFLSQSFDLDASRLTQPAVDPLIIGGDRRLRAALAVLQWSIGRPRAVRAYLVVEGGFSWLRQRTLVSDSRRFSGTLGRWMTSGGGGLELRLGPYGAFVEARHSHRYEPADEFVPMHPWSVTAGLVF